MEKYTEVYLKSLHLRDDDYGRALMNFYIHTYMLDKPLLSSIMDMMKSILSDEQIMFNLIYVSPTRPYNNHAIPNFSHGELTNKWLLYLHSLFGDEILPMLFKVCDYTVKGWAYGGDGVNEFVFACHELFGMSINHYNSDDFIRGIKHYNNISLLTKLSQHVDKSYIRDNVINLLQKSKKYNDTLINICANDPYEGYSFVIDKLKTMEIDENNLLQIKARIIFPMLYYDLDFDECKMLTEKFEINLKSGRIVILYNIESIYEIYKKDREIRQKKLAALRHLLEQKFAARRIYKFVVNVLCTRQEYIKRYVEANVTQLMTLKSSQCPNLPIIHTAHNS